MNTKISVSGMTCDHCVNSVTEEISKLDGVTDVKIDLDSGNVEITSSHELNESEIALAVEEAGYEVK